jgi:hypothetical protein
VSFYVHKILRNCPIIFRFLNVFFAYQMLMIENAKGIEIGRKFNYYTYQCIGFQHVFDPLNYKI